LGRGSFTESFPLYGLDLRNYEELFEEKIDLFAQILKEKPVSWEGKLRPSLENADIFPKTDSGHLETLVGVGGSPNSIVRAAAYNFPVVLAIIGGSSDRFVPFVELYRRATEQFGHTAHPLGVHSPGFIAETDEEAIKKAFPLFKESMDRSGSSGNDSGSKPVSRYKI
jgi:alkanesulfonate monooxygenase SsuD/methylene tetrahydromethanopterin reductase-like flavin-dependent oxidoreductase (luciferase family)